MSIDRTGIRVGAVNYLNTKPLVFGLRDLAARMDLCFDLPSRLADGLAARRYDVALIPSIEYFHGSGYKIVSDACIACRGPVLSVKLFSRVSPDRIRTLALDEGSRTSAALVQILLRERFGLRPQLTTLPIGDSLAQADTDAVLLIGDRAIHSPRERFEGVWDLGDEWQKFTGLPFVFAMWTARAGTDLSGVGETLAAARDLGVQSLEKIAERESAPLGLTRPECLSYLRDNLHFYLGEDELRGLATFYQYAVKLGLAPEGLELGIVLDQTAR